MPAYGRNHTSQVLEAGRCHFMIDCGEGTQIRMQHCHIKHGKIDHILISHLHGDHYLGLVGLLKSMHLQNRRKDLYLYGPKGLDDIITLQLKYSNTTLNYNLHFIRTNPEKNELIFENKFISVYSFPLDHRISCTGFLFTEQKKPYRIDKDKLLPGLSLVQIAQLKKGEDITDESEGLIYKNDELTLPPRKSRSYAFCSDTRYNERILPTITGLDLIYHESTFLKEDELRASNTYHSTAEQAATMAKKAGVERLIIGHYSARYRDISLFEQEAKKIFGNTHLAIEGHSYEVKD